MSFTQDQNHQKMNSSVKVHSVDHKHDRSVFPHAVIYNTISNLRGVNDPFMSPLEVLNKTFPALKRRMRSKELGHWASNHLCPNRTAEFPFVPFSCAISL